MIHTRFVARGRPQLVRPLSAFGRQTNLSRLQRDEPYDLLVVGGGAVGAGTALDAALRGLNVALVERGDFASETSSRSTKLIWAGIRYLGTGLAQLLSWQTIRTPLESISKFRSEFAMVLNCHRERRFLLEMQPHLTHWMPIAVPIDRWLIYPAPMSHPLFSLCPIALPFLMKFYDALSGFRCPPSYVMRPEAARSRFPQLTSSLKYAQVFYEGMHNDARTNLAIALSAATEGVTIANYTEATELVVDSNGRATGVRCRSRLDDEESAFEVRARAIVFAGGPFTDGLRTLEDPNRKPAVQAAAGTHVVLPAYYSPRDMGLLDINTSDGRFLFFLPWQGAALVGTTDRSGVAASAPGPPEDEIQWILNEVGKYLRPELRVRRGDVLSAWQGWRPLASDPHAPPGAPPSRDHVISTNPVTGVTFVTGGKWTTYREMAEEVVDRVCELGGFDHAKQCETLTYRLHGGVGYDEMQSVRLVQKYGVSQETAEHLSSTYGTKAFAVCEASKPTGKRWPRFGKPLVEGFPHIESEVTYAVREEMACTVADVLTLRTRLAFVNTEAALEAAPRVAELMAAELNWDEDQREGQLQHAIDYIMQFGGPVANKLNAELAAVTQHDLAALFAALDTDGNGSLDRHEVKTAAEQMGFPFESEATLQAAFDEMDVSGDGRVTEEEFALWWNDVKDSELRDRLSRQFEMTLDKIKDSRGVAFG